MWRGDLPKAGVEGNVPGVMGWRGDLPKAGVDGNFSGVVEWRGDLSKAGMEGEFSRSDGCGGEIFQSWSGGKVPLVVTFIITDSMQIDFEVIRCPVNQELLVIN